MKYCKKCVMPDTRPGIYFDDEGICQACRAEEKKNSTDWNARYKELEVLCDKYRGMNGNGYDCIIAVSGGKDSHYQVHVMKELMKMNPLLVTVDDNFILTKAGKQNLENISEEFGCDLLMLRPNRKVNRLLTRKLFEKYGKPTWYFDRLIYTYPLHMAVKFNLPLVVYGENISYEYGGHQREETYSAIDQVNNGVASGIEIDELLDDQISIKDLALIDPPSLEEMNAIKIDPIYISYFMRWSSYKNYIFAKSRGFVDLTHEIDRQHHIENFDQIDSMAYLVHPWMKYPKFGHSSATDYASKFIRYGMISRDQAIQLVKERDHRLDKRTVQEFCDYTGYSRSEFYAIVDRFYNTDIFEKDINGEWKLKNPLK